MKRAIVMAVSVLLALVVAAPIATAQASANPPSLATQTALWWDWVAATDSSPLEGEYGAADNQCDGDVDGVFFLSGSNSSGTVERTCTVPANTPLLFPVFNSICSEAWTDPVTGEPSDPTPYPDCAKNLLNTGGKGESNMYATLDGKNLPIRRIPTASFEWTIGNGFDAFTDNDGSLLEPGTYDAGTAGYWVYLPKGLKPGTTYTLNFGGSFFAQPDGSFGYSPDVIYTLTVE